MLSANFLYQNYKQAIRILEDEEHAVSLVENAHHCDRQDFPRFLQEELVYLNSLKADPPEITAKIEYANALEQYYDRKYVLSCTPYGLIKPTLGRSTAKYQHNLPNCMQ